MQHTKYKSCGPDDFREDDFKSFSHDKSIGAKDHWVFAHLDPRGMAGRIYVDH